MRGESKTFRLGVGSDPTRVRARRAAERPRLFGNVPDPRALCREHLHYAGFMCSHYQAIKRDREMQKYFRARGIDPATQSDIWPGYLAPYITNDGTPGERVAHVGRFGLLPHWAKDEKFGRHTYNARTETVAEKPSFRDSWRRGRRCIIPAEAFFEPCYETGKAVPWRIHRADGAPMGIAGLWSAWRAPDGQEVFSFAMLTVNADAHSLMRRFHKPTDEKRMVVILDEADYDRWLDCPPDQMMGMMTRYAPEQLTAEPVA